MREFDLDDAYNAVAYNDAMCLIMEEAIRKDKANLPDIRRGDNVRITRGDETYLLHVDNVQPQDYGTVQIISGRAVRES